MYGHWTLNIVTWLQSPGWTSPFIQYPKLKKYMEQHNLLLNSTMSYAI